MSTMGSPASFSRSAKSGFAGFTATPRWVTTTSTSLPGVEIQRTRPVMMGRRARNSGAMIMESFAPAAVSECPPEPPMMQPAESVCTFTLKSVSISVAPSRTTSRWSTTALFAAGLAYCMAEISWWAGFVRMDSTAFRSKHCTSIREVKQPSFSMSTR